jgi:hypothetical protein
MDSKQPTVSDNSLLDAKKKAFIENLLKCFGNVSQAAQLSGIHRQTFYDWKNNDEQFEAIIAGIKPDDFLEAKKDFIESKLMSLVAKGNPAAVIFAAKTICQDRGYVERQQLDVKSISVNWHETTIIDAQDQTNESDKETINSTEISE